MDWIERLNRAGVGRIALGDGGAAIEVLDWSYEKNLADNVPHRHTFFEICLVGKHGLGEFRVEGRPHVIGPGDLFLARPGVVHQIVNTRRPCMELYWTAFVCPARNDKNDDEIGGLLRHFAESPVLVARDEGGRIGGLWRMLRDLTSDRPRPGLNAQVAGLASALLLAIAQAGAGPDAPPSIEPGGPDPAEALARRAVRYIEDNIVRPLSVAEVAAQVGLSPRHLARVFAKFTETAPAAYIERARLDRACALLRHTDTPIKNVAQTVGYANVHHFSRAFSRRLGCPPGAYRSGQAIVPNRQRPGTLV